jgi:hypothetical protein
MLNGCLLLQNVTIAFGRVEGRFVTHLSGYWKFDLFSPLRYHELGELGHVVLPVSIPSNPFETPFQAF